MTRTDKHSRKPLPLSGQLLLTGLLCATAGPALSQGQQTPSQQATRAVTRAEDVLRRPGEDDPRWHFAIGLVSNYSPEYSGSRKMGHAFAPAARISWRGYSISRSSVARASASHNRRVSETGLAGPLWHVERFSFGLGLSINRGRDVDEEDLAKGLKPLRGTLIGRLRMRYDLTRTIQLQARLLGDVLGRQGGFEIPVGIGWSKPLGRKLLLSVDAGVTWANGNSMRNSYGIGEREHAGLRARLRDTFGLGATQVVGRLPQQRARRRAATSGQFEGCRDGTPDGRRERPSATFVHAPAQRRRDAADRTDATGRVPRRACAVRQLEPAGIPKRRLRRRPSPLRRSHGLERDDGGRPAFQCEGEQIDGGGDRQRMIRRVALVARDEDGPLGPRRTRPQRHRSGARRHQHPHRHDVAASVGALSADAVMRRDHRAPTNMSAIPGHSVTSPEKPL